MASPRTRGVINAARRTMETGGAKGMRACAGRRIGGGGPARARLGLMRVVVVESPAKAKTLARYLGAGHRVLACYGHVVDLPAKAGSVRPEDDFAMVYETAGRRAARALGRIRVALEGADTLVLATDPDREGEAIAWQVLGWLEERSALGGRTVERVAFHEVTPAAVRRAMARPRAIDMDLVRAWQARRALDYLVGYGLSPVLWRKLPGCRSAGRVQSVALRLVCEREAEIDAFAPSASWRVEATVSAPGGEPFAAVLCRLDGAEVGEAGLASEHAAREAAARIEQAPFHVASVERDMLRRAPPPPFTTSTLQQEAARRLGLGIGETMDIAQRLYEGMELGAERAGLITYLRTDSTALAKSAVTQARAAVRAEFGEAYLSARPRGPRPGERREGRARFAQEAHEAIRPTDFARTAQALERRIGRSAAALYGLIRARALASQMAAARIERVRVELACDDGEAALVASGAALAFDGHLRVRGEDARDVPGETTLPALAQGDPVTLGAVRVARRETAPPARYGEAGLVRRLDALGIGRPSTWAAIVAVLREREYVQMRERRFVPTERGRVATAFLEGYFGRWMEYGFSARMEADLDRVAGGGLASRAMLGAFWGPFHAALEAAGELERAAVLTSLEGRLERYLFADGARRCPGCGEVALELRLSRHGPFVGCARYPGCGYRRGLDAAGDDGYTGPRALGADPGSGLAVTLRRGPNGWYVQRGEDGGQTKPERTSLPPETAPDAVDLDLARRLLSLPREVGPHPDTGAPILAGIGRYGPWLRHRETYAAIPDDEDVLAMGLNRAVALIADKEVRTSRAREPKRTLRKLGSHPADGAPVWLKSGRHGPFVAHRRRYASVPGDVDGDALTLEQAVALLER